MPDLLTRLFSATALVGASLILAVPGASAATDTGHAEMRCQAFYTPVRSIWVRTVGLDYDGKQLNAVSIDGVKVYSFQINGTRIFTALDNERIQIDTGTLQWSSDYRGAAQSQGRCEWVKR
ncbi:hypothetical protein [Amphibiibacter pelophylacis]|uniref:Uncharacterized protein n=1 Tax=Amphibiibacter pelophylacis TaxID=1799477 RepID=A0ACC6P0T0_9BURK